MTRLTGWFSLFVLLLLPAIASAQQAPLQYFRPLDQSGVTMFEPSATDTTPYDGFKVYWGAAFTQQLQGLDHENAADPNLVNGEDLNALVDIGTGFNLATANLYLGAQLADGVRVHLTTYLSSRHHPEAWVKGGYVQVDKLTFFENDTIDRLMENVTLRVGHFEINYGDAHFRRTDNGNALYNPFVGNYIMDAFTTEIGAEVYVHGGGFFGMAAVTGGEIKGSVLRGDDRAPSFYGKLGVDRQVSDALRVRLTGSAYTTAKSLNNTLYGGDRAGSRYYDVLVNAQAAGKAFTNGRWNPNFRDDVTAFVVNPFVKAGGFEAFGVLEWSSGSLATEPDNRLWNQYAVEALYRFLGDESLYVGGRYNIASGELPFSTAEVSIDRFQIGAGWFVTPNMLLKGEYVQQNYNDFPTSDLLHEAQFSGFMIEGVIAF